jgi:hypothetical protein
VATGTSLSLAPHLPEPEPGQTPAGATMPVLADLRVDGSGACRAPRRPPVPPRRELARSARYPASPGANGGSARPSRRKWSSPSEDTAISAQPRPAPSAQRQRSPNGEPAGQRPAEMIKATAFMKPAAGPSDDPKNKPGRAPTACRFTPRGVSKAGIGHAATQRQRHEQSPRTPSSVRHQAVAADWKRRAERRDCARHRDRVPITLSEQE